MKNYQGESSEEFAIERWENEGGEVPEVANSNIAIAIENRRNAKNENQHSEEVRDGSFEQNIVQKVF